MSMKAQNLKKKNEEERKYKSLPSRTLNDLIPTVLSSKAFGFNNKVCKQIERIAMATQITSNCVNIFVDKIENEVINAYYKKTK